jgi:cytochrome c-type biogenesis protein CcmH/NrfG
LNDLGYHALEKKDFAGAISILKVNAEMFPESSNAYDSLGDAYAAAGDTANAVASLETSLRLDPKNEHAAKLLDQLRRATKAR